MFRKILYLVLSVYAGILIGEIPLGNSTIGRTAWEKTKNFGDWTTDQTHSLIKYAGFGEIGSVAVSPPPPPPLAPAAPKMPAPPPRPVAPLAPAPQPRKLEPAYRDPEGLSFVDKAEIRKILE